MRICDKCKRELGKDEIMWKHLDGGEWCKDCEVGGSNERPDAQTKRYVFHTIAPNGDKTTFYSDSSEKEIPDGYKLVGGHSTDYACPACPFQPQPLADMVNHPPHYTQGGIQTLDFIKAKLGDEKFRAYCIANVWKYTTRYEMKNGLQDLEKAAFYLKRAIGSLRENALNDPRD